MSGSRAKTLQQSGRLMIPNKISKISKGAKPLITAATKRGKGHSFEGWHEPQIIVYSASQQSPT